MGMTIKEEFNGAGLVFEYSGVLTGDEVIAESKRHYVPDKLKTLRYQIADLREVSRIELSFREIQSLAELDKNAAIQAGGFLIASVVDHDLQESVSAFYGAAVNDPAVETKIFHSMSEARQWLQEKLADKGLVLDVVGAGREKLLA